MAYDEYLSDRIRSILTDKKVTYFSKGMVGGLLFLLLCSTACRPTTTKEQDTVHGKVVSVGDTFTMLLDHKPQ